MAGVYIHIPYCSQACHYCDFHFSTNHSNVSELCDAIVDELMLQKNYLGNEPVETVYFGGGTPSVIALSSIEKILEVILKIFTTNSGLEVTLEANPEDLTSNNLMGFHSMGINRLSIGVQSFDDSTLRFLNRSHDGSQARTSIENARKTGFKNLNVDLIYAIPGRDREKLNRDLTHFTELEPEHISAYSLTIESKTVFGKWAKDNKFHMVTDEENATQFEMVLEELSNAGYDQYEVSNYAQPGFLSIHNTNYWRQKNYLGVGPSAHSYNGESRQANVSNNNTYVKAIQAGSIPATIERLTQENRINEYLMTSLRTKWGCDLNYLKLRFNYDLLKDQTSTIDLAIKNGLMHLNGAVLHLTRRGKMHADKLSSDLFLIN